MKIIYGILMLSVVIGVVWLLTIDIELAMRIFLIIMTPIGLTGFGLLCYNYYMLMKEEQTSFLYKKDWGMDDD